MHCLDKGRHTFWRSELGYSVAKVEYVASVARTEAIQHLFRFGRDNVGLSKQHIRIYISLKRYLVADATTGITNVNCPV